MIKFLAYYLLLGVLMGLLVESRAEELAEAGTELTLPIRLLVILMWPIVFVGLIIELVKIFRNGGSNNHPGWGY